MDQHRFITRQRRTGSVVQHQRIAVGFTAVAARHDANANTALLQLLHQPDHHRRFAIAASGQVTNHHHRHRRAPGFLPPQLIAEANHPAHQAIQPGERQQQAPQRRFPGPDARDHSPNCILCSWAYTPLCSSRSWCVPRSTIRPSSTTTISSACSMVDRRWAITSEVRFFCSSSSAA